MLPKRCARLMWATHTKSPELLHSSPSPGWEGKAKGKKKGSSEEQQFWPPQPGLFFLSSPGMGEPGLSQGGCPLSPEPDPENGTTKHTFCCFIFCVEKGLLVGSRGKSLFAFRILQRKMFQEKGRGKKGSCFNLGTFV